jgi:Acyclic terpene utilisation family protein AtuA
VTEPIRIANCSGFFGDRLSAAQEMVDGGPIDVLTGDWLAELTMLILVRQKMKHGNGYARTFLTQMEAVLGTCVDRGIAVVSNAGGLDPVGLGSALAELGDELGIPLRIGVVSGDDLMPRLADLVAAGEEFVNLDTGERLSDVGVQPITANAYLGAEPITRALAAGADVVVTGRVTDAALVIGPAAWRHGWDYAAARAGDQATLDALAGALVAGHVIECGAQATGGNYAFFTDVPGLEHPGFPIAEVASDGSSVITKHAGSGGMVTVGTVTAQLLYEIGGPLYLNPDVTADFETIRLEQEARDRVRVSGTRGVAPPERLKVAMNYLGGFRNSLTLVMTGLDADAKADLALRTVVGLGLEQARQLAGDPAALAAASSLDVAQLSVELDASGGDDPQLPADAQSFLRLTVKDPDGKKAGKPFTAPVIEATLSSYPGLFPTTPPGAASPYGVYWPTTVSRGLVPEAVTLDGQAVDGVTR